ncbi:hypothetical protein VQ056_00870 [Paenibacillus sp. JTLBN-2024]
MKLVGVPAACTEDQPDRPQYRHKLEDIQKRIQESRHLRVNVT